MLTCCFHVFAQEQVVVDANMSGSWYDASHNGEGFVLQVLQDDTALAYWFTYDESGAQRWFFAVGTVIEDSIVFNEVLLARGAAFGDQFNSEDVEVSSSGSLTINWFDCFSANATYTIDGIQGSQALTRITTLAGLDCTNPSATSSAVTGSWFDQTHNGEGLVIEKLIDDRVLVYWFSYDVNGDQAWFFGSGEQNGQAIDITDVYVTSGGRFGADFDPQDVQVQPWGNIQIELGCEYGKLDYQSQLTGFGQGKQTLTRLTRVGNPLCDEAPAPNILLLIADDLGKDASSLYNISAQQPSTPTLDGLANSGLVFENAWSSPTCSPTRAGILTGKYSNRTGVFFPGNVLSEDETSLQSYIHQLLPNRYSDAIIGKWHVGPGNNDLNHPAKLGISHYAGIISGGVPSYFDWDLTTNGTQTAQTEYVTSKLVDLAIDWTNEQNQPWFLWLAFNAPHTPFHLPPEHLHNRQLSGTTADIDANPMPYYFAAIEAMDTEIGRLLDSLDPSSFENTIVVFIGDNGTPSEVAQSPYQRGQVKGSLNQGGINIPFMISGPGVGRMGERENALLNTTDLFSTLAALAGVNVDQINDSTSFIPLLNESASTRQFQFSERKTNNTEEWVISDGSYKLFESETGEQELYDLTIDPYENTDLIAAGNAPSQVVNDLASKAAEFRQQ